MRLTNRNYKNTTLELESCKPYLKLGQLEDIEEELGIDLLTLFKALKDGIYPKRNKFSVPVHLMKKWGTNEFILENGYESPSWYYLKDYGKTWALTREELEQ